MSILRPTQRKHRFDTAAPRVRRPKSRRLAIEAMESRLMLSGTDLDTSLYNLDSIAVDFAVISTIGNTNSHRLGPIGNLGGVLDYPVLADGSNDGLVASSAFLDSDLGVDHLLSNGPSIHGWSTSNVGRIVDDATFGQVNGTTVDGRNAAEIEIVAEDEGPASSALVERSLPGLLDEATEVTAELLRYDELSNAEGGMIPIAPLVAALENRPLDAIHDQDESAAPSRRPIVESTSRSARPATANLSGELARAVAFEMIEAEAAPLARATVVVSDRAIAAVEVSPPQPVARRSQAIGPIRLARFAGSAADRVDVRLAAVALTRDAAELSVGEAVGGDRGEVFSDWTGPPPAERPSSFDLSPFLVIVALERIVSAKGKREQQSAVPARRGAPFPNQFGLAAAC